MTKKKKAIIMQSPLSQTPVFTIKELTKIYGTGKVEVRALNGVDMQLFNGEMVVLLGPSGSGKSTFLNIIGGLDHATSGIVEFMSVIE